jgi:hypothetical protein
VYVSEYDDMALNVFLQYLGVHIFLSYSSESVDIRHLW